MGACARTRMPFLRGRLHIVAAEARAGGESLPEGDLYAVFRAGHSVRETAAAPRAGTGEAASVSWNQAFQFRVLDTCSLLHVQLRLRRGDGVDELLGRAVVSIVPYRDGRLHDDWISMRPRRSRGTSESADADDPDGLRRSSSASSASRDAASVAWQLRLRIRHQKGFVAAVCNAFLAGAGVAESPAAEAEAAESLSALHEFAASSDSDAESRGPSDAARAFSPRRVLGAYDELRVLLLPLVRALDFADSVVGCVDPATSAAGYAALVALWWWSPPVTELVSVAALAALAVGLVRAQFGVQARRVRSKYLRPVHTPLPGDTAAGVKLSCIVSKDRASSTASDCSSPVLARSGSFRSSRAAGEALLVSGQPETERFLRVVAKVQLVLARCTASLSAIEDLVLWREPRRSLVALLAAVALFMASSCLSMYDLAFLWISVLFALNTRAAEWIVAGSGVAGSYARRYAPPVVDAACAAMGHNKSE